jgi:PAS domain S-box-containing protein
MVARKKFTTLVAALLEAPPQRIFITEYKDEENISAVNFEQFIYVAQIHAEELRSQGVQVGDRVILLLPQGVQLMAAFAGAMFLGAVPAILAYPNFKVDPAKYASGLSGVTQNLGARLVVVDEAFPKDLLHLMKKAKGSQIVRIPSTSNQARPASTDFRYESDHLAFIQHSAGTTGLQKGVALTHRAVLTQLEHLASALEVNDQDRIYSWLPLYHDMGLISCFMLPLVYHLPVVMQSPMGWVVRPNTMLEVISDHRCTLAWVPNFALQFVARRVRAADVSHCDLSSLRGLINCSEPIRSHSMDEFQATYATLGLRADALKSSYAMAENVFAVTQSPINGVPRRLWIAANDLWQKHLAVRVTEKSPGSLCVVSSGRCLEDNQVRIVSSEGTDLPDGAVGEILIRSASLFNGYFNRPDLTAKALQGGWYWSGDLGFSLDGELYVIGRAKDLIIVAGKNIYPQDIEEIVCNHPAIHDGRSVAFGMYNPDLGTQEVIVVAETESEEELKNASEIERELRSAIVSELDVTPRAICLKPPRWIVKSTAGKAARSTTREKLLIEHPELLGKSYIKDRKLIASLNRERPLPAAVPLEEDEYLLDFGNDIIITRNIDGRINLWNRHAEELYGWKKEEAIGKVSHSLLQTQFPIPLDEIESELVRNGRWEGKLVHTTRDGRRVAVESRWTLDPTEKSGAVVEINRRFTDAA